MIDPIENMLERVKHISSDPLSAIQEEEERVLIQELERKKMEESIKIKKG